MKEIISINLDNEMDLILAHKRSLKLAEICGLMSSAQTRFATAVSEIARCSIANGENSSLVLGINSLSGGKKEILAVLNDKTDLAACNPGAFAYAKKLLNDVNSHHEKDVYKITLTAKVPYSGILSEGRINSFVEYFKKEAPLSPYDEIRKKNIQLIELSDRLSESENNYRQLTDTLPFIVFSVSKSDKVFVINKTAEKILGSNFKEFSLSTIGQIIYAKDIEQIVKAWNNAKKKYTPQTLQARMILQGDAIWHEVSIVPNTDEKKNTTGWIISMVNIHTQKLIEETLKDNKELKEAQEKLRITNDELHIKNKELEQFAYIASHDLQEPLRKIKNFISLADRIITPEQRESLYFDKINTAAGRMSYLVKDILNYSRLASNNQFEVVNLDAILQEVLQDLELSVKEKKAVITVDPLPVIHANRVQMNQLFYNLVGNALKFNNGAPRVNIKYTLVEGGNYHSILTKGSYHSIAIEDNGIGIDEQYYERIFLIFQRLHPQNVFQGTGIGLSLCRRIAENHNGIITVKSRSGGGSVFTIYLPTINI